MFGLRVGKVTDISLKGFKRALLVIVFPVLGAPDLLTVPGFRVLILPPLYPGLIILALCLLLDICGANMTSVGMIISRLRPR